METITGVIVALIALFTGILGSFSHTAAFVAEPLTLKSREATVLFGGDMMFDRSIRLAAEREGEDFILSCLDPVLAEADLVVANLEGPITAEPSVSARSAISAPENFTFTFPLSTAKLLARHGIRMVNIGNNHIENFKRAGVLSTIEALNAAGVAYFGDTFEQKVANAEAEGVRFAFINFNQFAYSSSREKSIEQIRAAVADGRIAIVYAHWGDEYVPANDLQKEIAHAFVDAGAEAVIGSHPHVVQEHEVYAGKHIYYSLGNLVFDQYWSEQVRNGLMIRLTFTERGVRSVEEVPVELLRDRRTCPAGTN